MSGVLVDSDVLLDIATENPLWSSWSAQHLARCADGSELVINPLIYAEVSVAFTSIDTLDGALPLAVFRREPLPWEACFLAGKSLLRSRQGGRRGALELYVGAHAVVGSYRLLTRSPEPYRLHYPEIDLIAPSAEELAAVRETIREMSSGPVH